MRGDEVVARAGSPVFMASALFKTMTGLQAPLAQHSSDAAGIADLLAGKVQTHFAGAGAVTQDIVSELKIEKFGNVSSAYWCNHIPNEWRTSSQSWPGLDWPWHRPRSRRRF
jgi:hypothetical protein